MLQSDRQTNAISVGIANVSLKWVGKVTYGKFYIINEEPPIFVFFFVFFLYKTITPSVTLHSPQKWIVQSTS